jgi:hypothetical protein
MLRPAQVLGNSSNIAVGPFMAPATVQRMEDISVATTGYTQKRHSGYWGKPLHRVKIRA